MDTGQIVEGFIALGERMEPVTWHGQNVVFCNRIGTEPTPQDRVKALAVQVKGLIDANAELEDRVKHAFRLYRSANETANILTDQVTRLVAEKDQLDIQTVAMHARNAELWKVLDAHGLRDEAEAVWYRKKTVSDQKPHEVGDAVSEGTIPGELERDQSAHS